MLHFRVAGHLFRIESSREEEIHRLMSNYIPFETLPTKGERPLFSLSLDEVVPAPDFDEMSFGYDLTEDKAKLHYQQERYVLTIHHTASRTDFRLECPTAESDDPTEPRFRFRCDFTAKGFCPPRHILDHQLIFALSLASLKEETLLIHSSVILFDGKAVMFLGESGTGKSTHTRLWREHIAGSTLLNDDAPALRLYNGVPTVFGTPWSGKLPCYKNESHPLAACIRLRQAPFNKIRRLDTVNAFGALLPSCLPTLQQRDEALDSICDTLSTTLSATPVYLLDCLPDADAARLSWSTVFKKP